MVFLLVPAFCARGVTFVLDSCAVLRRSRMRSGLALFDALAPGGCDWVVLAMLRTTADGPEAALLALLR